MLWTPGNPPVSVPGEGDGLLGAVATAVFRRRIEPLERLLAEEVAARRGGASDDGISTASVEVDGGEPAARPPGVLSLVAAADPALTAEAIADELLPLLMAAQEPSAAALTWLLERLTRTRDLAERYLEAGDGDPFRDAVVRETLRLRPAGAGGPAAAARAT